MAFEPNLTGYIPPRTASILGGILKGTISTDLNDLDVNGYYFAQPPQSGWGALNYPSNSWALLQIVANDSGLFQYFWGYDGIMYYRRKYFFEWSSWVQVSTDVPSFYKDYNTLASLASALGVFQHGGEYNGDLDANMESGCYEVIPTDGNHAPTNTRGVLLNFVSSDVYYRFQIYAIADHLYSRFCVNINSWYSWHTIY